jgi:hypothetical protein
MLLSLWTLSSLAESPSPNKTEKLTAQRLEVNLGEGCRFMFADIGKKGSRLPIDLSESGVSPDPYSRSDVVTSSPQSEPRKSTMKSLKLDMECDDKQDPDSEGPDTNNHGAKYVRLKKVWEKDLDRWFDSTDLEGDGRKILDKATRVVNIKAVNSKGFAQLTDDIIGNERGRRRNMNFCLFHPPKALCGDGVVAQLDDGAKGDLTQYTLEILKSIEFLDDTPVNSQAPAK